MKRSLWNQIILTLSFFKACIPPKLWEVNKKWETSRESSQKSDLFVRKYIFAETSSPAHSQEMVGYPLLVLFLLVADIESSSHSDSRLPWVGARLRLALRQAKRSSDNDQPMLKTIQNGSQRKWKSNEHTRLCENSDTGYQTSQSRSKVEPLEEMIKNLQHAIEAKQQRELMRIVKRPKIDGRIRILKVCNWYMCY